MKKVKFSIARRDEAMWDLMETTDQRTLAAWAIECAERVLPYFEERFPRDDRPRVALQTLKGWIDTGAFRMGVIRDASLSSHAAARDAEEDSPARSAARAAGQAVATAHVYSHSIGSAIYAQQAIHHASEATEARSAVARERDWQYHRLMELRAGTLR
jgi:hypothetical protein